MSTYDHPQMSSVREIIATLESLLSTALADREMDLVVSYASALDAMTRTLMLLELKSGAAPLPR